MRLLPRRALLVGGARSGKSEIAERLIAAWANGSPITYVATALLDGGDATLAERVARHEQRRISSATTWSVVDAGADLAATLRSHAGPVLLDSLGPWVAVFADDRAVFDAQLEGVVEAVRQRDGDTVVVSDEVGMSVHSSTEVGRWFADALGTANAAVARVADPIWLCVAGRVVPTVSPDAAIASVLTRVPAEHER